MTGAPPPPMVAPAAAPNPLVAEMKAGARRHWLPLLMIAFAAFFDFRLNGDIVTAILGIGAAVPFLLWRSVMPQVMQLVRGVPPALRGMVLAGAPTAVIYILRWRGTQDLTTAILTMAATLGLGFVIAASRQRLASALSPLLRARNRVLPRPVRLVLMFVIPTVLAFAIAHGSLADIGALIGAPTNSPTSASTNGWQILISTVVSAVIVVILISEPPAAAVAP